MTNNHISRRGFLQSSAALALSGPAVRTAAGESIGGRRPLLKPLHDAIVCPWTPEHPRHDHQLIFPLDGRRFLLVWSEYYSKSKQAVTEKGRAGISNSVSCQISSKISTDVGRSWGSRRVMQANMWKQNVKHSNLRVKV